MQTTTKNLARTRQALTPRIAAAALASGHKKLEPELVKQAQAAAKDTLQALETLRRLKAERGPTSQRTSGPAAAACSKEIEAAQKKVREVAARLPRRLFELVEMNVVFDEHGREGDEQVR